MKTPAVSVVLPAYNAEAYLDDAIQSVRDQTFADFELIIINDGSTDRTAEILAQHAVEDRRIAIVTQVKSGLVTALNHGLRQARAPLIARMDADDICMPKRFEMQVAYLAKHPRVLALGTNITRIGATGAYKKAGKYPVGPAKIRRQMRKGCKIAHPSVMMRRRAVLQVGGYREICQRGQDYDLWLRLLDIGELDNLPDTLLHYREHDENVSSKNVTSQIVTGALVKWASDRRRAGLPDPLTGAHPPLSISLLYKQEENNQRRLQVEFEIFRRLVRLRDAPSTEITALTDKLWTNLRAAPSKVWLNYRFWRSAFKYRNR